MTINKDSLYDFFKEPTLETFLQFYNTNIGETNEIDFKTTWIEFDKLARIILGIANCGGGCIVIGLTENNGVLNAIGVNDDKVLDPADFTKKIAKFIPESVLNRIQLNNFFYDSDAYNETIRGKKLQVIFITMDDIDLPIICNSDSNATIKGEIYFRRGTSTERINYEELRQLIENNIKKRKAIIQTKKLKDELDDLKNLYDSIPIFIKNMGFSAIKQNPFYMSIIEEEKNKIYPEKSYEQFLMDMITSKQERIKNLLER